MIIDFEQVKFDTTKAWEESSNRASVGSLMSYFMTTRKPGRVLPISSSFPCI
ncbi:hypothetical protein QBC46DRAFT_380606 [Diplogelasinospora grovesii]|uniref:Uncharacterized protein n=1 Tax=Diplogelasinospora grovesii TaxID=303347 RepID=A0AAN6S6D6_9PEZI|nr:hypothetical protein QBC46DRAFT_380606 [Diplogelasinospora grovesii]